MVRLIMGVYIIAKELLLNSTKVALEELDVSSF
jgi:hypothetical protein